MTFVIKRKSRSFVRSRIPELSEKEIGMKIIAYNIRSIVVLDDSGINFIIEDFYRAEQIFLFIKILNIYEFLNNFIRYLSKDSDFLYFLNKL